MHATRYLDVSIRWSTIMLKLTGVGATMSRKEEYQRRGILVYIAITHIISGILHVDNIKHSLDHISDCIYSITTIFYIILALLKVFILNVKRPEFLNLTHYAERNFWITNYDHWEKRYFNDCQKFCRICVIAICIVTQICAASYILPTVYANIGRNKSDRVLPLKVWLHLPMYVTPYYELMFLFQMLSVVQIALGYSFIDNFMCILNMNVTCQFRILQHRFMSVWTTIEETGKEIDYETCYRAFKKCIREHQSLIAYCDKVEDVYTFAILAHFTIFGVMACFDTYEIFLATDIATGTRLIFIFHLIGSFGHIVFFSFTCHMWMEESQNIGTVVYSGMWPVLPMGTVGRMIRHDVQIILNRSLRPCCLTAGGFFIVSLQTATSLFSSTMSYFTLLKESTQKME